MSLSVKEKLERARKLAGELTKEQSNLIRHAINYLRLHRDRKKLAAFLETDHFSATSQKHWPATRSAIKALVNSVSELDDIDYILGWVWRLRKVPAKPDRDERGESRGSRVPRGALGGRTQPSGRKMNPGEAERRARDQQRGRW